MDPKSFDTRYLTFVKTFFYKKQQQQQQERLKTENGTQPSNYNFANTFITASRYTPKKPSSKLSSPSKAKEDEKGKNDLESSPKRVGNHQSASASKTFYGETLLKSEAKATLFRTTSRTELKSRGNSRSLRFRDYLGSLERSLKNQNQTYASLRYSRSFCFLSNS